MSIEIYIELSGHPPELKSVVDCFGDFSRRDSNEDRDRFSEIQSASFTNESVDFVSFLESVASIKRRCGIPSGVRIDIWYLDLDSMQGNGELSSHEIRLLNEIGANFCWTMIPVN